MNSLLLNAHKLSLVLRSGKLPAQLSENLTSQPRSRLIKVLPEREDLVVFFIMPDLSSFLGTRQSAGIPLHHLGILPPFTHCIVVANESEPWIISSNWK